MKSKLLLAAAVAALMIAPAAMAQEGGKGEHGEHKGKGAHHHHAKMLEKVDTDGDGKVSKAEFVTSHEARFDEIDADDDGFLSGEEMKSAWEKKREKFKGKMKEWRENKTDDQAEVPAEDTE